VFELRAQPLADFAFKLTNPHSVVLIWLKRRTGPPCRASGPSIDRTAGV
jgi:hypothetical protein